MNQDHHINKEQHLEALSDIRSLMERSSRFISLSGLSGVFAGAFALVGAAMVYIYLGISPIDHGRLYYVDIHQAGKWGMDALTFFYLDATIVLILALIAAIFFTTRKARKKGQKVWGPLTRRLLINLAIPLVAGGIFCLGLVKHGLFGFVAPATLIFYGLALVNAGKFTLKDVRNLGLSEIALGLIGVFILGYGLEFWAIGFGLLHIIYGAVMYFKYERKSTI